MDLLPRSCATQGFDASDTIQAKEMSFHNQHPIDQFLPLAIEVLGCPHKQADVLLHNYANAIWSLKRPEGPHLSILITLFHQKISITLQKMQASFILNWAVVVSPTTS
jgi:hypothetical protein